VHASLKPGDECNARLPHRNQRRVQCDWASHVRSECDGAWASRVRNECHGVGASLGRYEHEGAWASCVGSDYDGAWASRVRNECDGVGASFSGCECGNASPRALLGVDFIDVVAARKRWRASLQRLPSPAAMRRRAFATPLVRPTAARDSQAAATAEISTSGSRIALTLASTRQQRGLTVCTCQTTSG